ncbi:hypothetical protein BJ878DRAFT_533864 [Calycina marina]|uniref:Uncharacterized protein n=1 Tax=Calycina marina TaxID=1763456 RepID=A0A9P8CFS7_9HELO|nr:hypothetical protein BJ878DRAFT_533864 [Calycina marina]
MADYTPDEQLYETLRASIAESFATRRPLLTHLNADTTWLLSLPYPSTSPSSNGRAYYHILLDPWLRGGQSDSSSVQTIAEVDEVIQRVEEAAHGYNIMCNVHVDHVDVGRDSQAGKCVDLVSISHEFTDHMHKDTLLEISPRVPLMATTKAASMIKSWRHFDSVQEISPFSGDWRQSSRLPLPEWLGISRVAYPGKDLLYYHSAIVFIFAGLTMYSSPEAVIYAPHGVSPSDVQPLADASPKVDTLALLHGLHDIKLVAKAQLNLDAYNGLKIQRKLKSKYWVGTHDEVKLGSGIVSWFLDRKVITVREALQREGEENGGDAELAALAEVNFKNISNGECLILE